MRPKTKLEDTTEQESRPSKSARKREMIELQAIGERLLELDPGHLNTVPMPDALDEAVAVARQMKKFGALNRQKQYIGKLMRQINAEPIRQALAAIDEEGLREKKVHHDAERWRDRLLGDGTPALEAFFDANPHADRQPLRQLLGQCQASPPGDRQTASRRRLYRELHAVLASVVDGDKNE